MNTDPAGHLSAYELSLLEPAPACQKTVTQRSGADCPSCGQGRLDYNGLLELACPLCGYVAAGAGGGYT